MKGLCNFWGGCLDVVCVFVGGCCYLLSVCIVVLRFVSVSGYMCWLSML